MNPRAYGDFGTCACAPSPQPPSPADPPQVCAWGPSTLSSCVLAVLHRGCTRVDLADVHGVRVLRGRTGLH